MKLLVPVIGGRILDIHIFILISIIYINNFIAINYPPGEINEVLIHSLKSARRIIYSDNIHNLRL